MSVGTTRRGARTAERLSYLPRAVRHPRHRRTRPGAIGPRRPRPPRVARLHVLEGPRAARLPSPSGPPRRAPVARRDHRLGRVARRSRGPRGTPATRPRSAKRRHLQLDGSGLRQRERAGGSPTAKRFGAPAEIQRTDARHRPGHAGQRARRWFGLGNASAVAPRRGLTPGRHHGRGQPSGLARLPEQPAEPGAAHPRLQGALAARYGSSTRARPRRPSSRTATLLRGRVPMWSCSRG